jgi:hypothetical protein
MRFESKWSIAALLSLGSLLLTSNASAAVDPTLFEQELRKRAFEAVTLDVVATEIIDNTAASGTMSIAASAVIREVVRTRTDLKVGDVVLVKYTLDVAAFKRQQAEMAAKAAAGWTGPQLEGLPARIEAGTSYRAFLNKVAEHAVQGESVYTASGLVYSPASAGASFEKIEASE